MIRSYDISNIATGLIDASVAPSRTVGRPPVVYLHGAANTPEELMGAVLPTIKTLMWQLPGFDLAVAAPWHYQKWGTPVEPATTPIPLDMSDDELIDAAILYLQNEYGCSDDPPVLIGGSMGACSALAYASRHDVACVVGFIPAADLDWLRENNYSGARAVIDAAHGTTWSAGVLLPAGRNPVTMAPGCPTQLWVASDDDFSTNVEGWADTYPSDVDFHDVGANGHSDASIQEVDFTTMINFIQANAA